MGQEQILRIMMKNRGRWFSSKAISNLTSVNCSSTKKSVSRIIKFKNIYGVEVKKGKRNKSFIRII